MAREGTRIISTSKNKYVLVILEKGLKTRNLLQIGVFVFYSCLANGSRSNFQKNSDISQFNYNNLSKQSKAFRKFFFNIVLDQVTKRTKIEKSFKHIFSSEFGFV